VEEHGKHLPVVTDALIAEKVAYGAAERVKGKVPVLVMPTVWSGYSTHEVKKWTGTISISLDTFMDMVLEICGSLIDMGFKNIVLINAHGNHPGALEVVVRKVADIYGVYIALTMSHAIAKDRIAPLLKAGPKGSCHGGEYETSLMLYLAEELVQKDKFTGVDVLKIKSEFYPGKVFISTWGRQKSKTGIYGDPTVATKETGRKLFEVIVDTYASFLKEYYKDEVRIS
jgi:creatinine amidohydrolase